MSQAPLVALEDLIAARQGSVDPSRFPGETFELYSIPAYDSRQPEALEGREIGSAKQVVEPEDVLLSKIVPHIRRSWIVGARGEHRQIASGEWIVFRSKRFVPEYLRHALLCDDFHAQFMQTVSGVGGSLLRARPAQVAKIRIPLPSLDEQRRIAAILDKADALRTKRREAITQLDRVAQSTYMGMFGDPGANPKRWPLVALGALISEKPSNGIFRKNEEYGDGLPVAWVEELFRGYSVDLSASRRLPASQEEVRKFGLKNGDILFCRSSLKLAGLGYNNVYLGPDNAALFECHVIRVSPRHELVDSEFMNFLLRIPSQRQRLFRFAKTVTMSTIDQEGIKNVEVPVPPLTLQKDFVKRLHAIQRSGVQMSHSTGPLESLFESLQQRAFSGAL